MVISLWILLVLFIGLGILSSLRCHNQAKRIQELQQSLLTANQTIRQREETYAENESRKQRTEEKLRSYLELLDTLINTIPNPIYFKDADGVFQGCNRVFSKKVLGLTRDRIIGKRPQNLPDHIPADQAAAHLREELKMAFIAMKHLFNALMAETMIFSSVWRQLKTNRANWEVV